MNWKITSQGILTGCSPKKNMTELIIPEGVKEIGSEAFQKCRTLKTVIIPEGVTRINGRAFFACESLRNIMIPETVTVIGKDAFEGTAWMKHYPDDFVILNHILIRYKGSFQDMPGEMHIPEGVYVINAGVLNFAPRIKKLILPEGLKTIGKRAFGNCDHLEEVHLPESVEKIGSHAFEVCRLLKRTPYLVYERKVFYRFPDFYPTPYRDKCMIQNHDYEIAMIPEVKYDLIFQMFALNIDPEGTGNYIQKHFHEMIPVLIRLNDFVLIEKFPALVQKYIDDLIQEAIEQKNYELQIMLTRYKHEHNLFSSKEWSL